MGLYTLESLGINSTEDGYIWTHEFSQWLYRKRLRKTEAKTINELHEAHSWWVLELGKNPQTILLQQPHDASLHATM